MCLTNNRFVRMEHEYILGNRILQLTLFESTRYSVAIVIKVFVLSFKLAPGKIIF
jgi:uncharacterized protein YqiB (DUF1249 family)